MGRAFWMCFWCNSEFRLASDLPDLYVLSAQWSVVFRRSLPHGKEANEAYCSEAYSDEKDNHAPACYRRSSLCAANADPRSNQLPRSGLRSEAERGGNRRTVPSAARWSRRTGAAIGGCAGLSRDGASYCNSEGRTNCLPYC